MTSRLTETVVDCADPVTQARFWAAVLDHEVLDEAEDRVEIGPQTVGDEQLLAAVRSAPVPPALVFVRVPDGKAGKNRLHFDVSPVDKSRDDEVARLESLGARRTGLEPEGGSWVVMADPEGNEFCVLRSLAPGHFSL